MNVLTVIVIVVVAVIVAVAVTVLVAAREFGKELQAEKDRVQIYKRRMDDSDYHRHNAEKRALIAEQQADLLLQKREGEPLQQYLDDRVAYYTRVIGEYQKAGNVNESWFCRGCRHAFQAIQLYTKGRI